MGTASTNENSIQEEIKSGLKSGKACCHSVQNLLSSIFLSNNIKTKICRAVILPVVLYGCEAWSPTVEEEDRVRVFENRMLRKVLGSKRDKVTEEWRILHKEEFYDLYCSLNIIWLIKSRRMRWAGHVAHIGDRREVHIGFWWGDLFERDHQEDSGIDGRIILKRGLKEVGWGGMDWLALAQDSNRWWVLVNVVMNFWVP